MSKIQPGALAGAPPLPEGKPRKAGAEADAGFPRPVEHARGTTEPWTSGIGVRAPEHMLADVAKAAGVELPKK